MAEKVTVQGGGDFDGAKLDNAASEATLLRLVEAFEKKGGSGGGAGGAGGSNQINRFGNAYLNALRGGTGGLNALTDTSGTLGKAFDKATSAASSFASSVASSVTSVAGWVAGGAITGLKLFTGFLFDATDSYRELTKVGAGFNQNMFEMSRTAFTSGIDMKHFAELVTKNADVLTSLGGSATDGAKRLAKLTEGMRDAGSNLYGLGMTTQDIEEYMGSYLQQQQRLGKGLNRENSELISGTKAYAEELDKVSKLTGLDRKKLQDQANKATLDPIFNRFVARIDQSTDAGQKQYAKAMANIGQVAEVGGADFSEAVKQLATGAVESGTLAAELQRTGAITQAEAKALANGTLDAATVMKKAGPIIAKSQEGMTDASIKSNKQVLAASELAIQLQRYAQIDQKKVEEQAKIRNATTEVMGKLTTTFDTFKNNIIGSLINSGVFAKVEVIIGKMAKALQEYEVPITNFFKTFVADIESAFERGGIGNALQVGFEKLFKVVSPIIGDIVKKIFSGFGGGGGSDKKQGLLAKKKDLEDGAFGAGWGSAEDATAYADINKQLAEMENIDPFATIKSGFATVMDIFNTIGDGLKTVTGFFSDWKTVLATLVVGGGALALLSPLLEAAGAGLTAVLAPVSLVVGAMGFAGLGLGAMFKGLSAVVDSFVEGFKSIPGVLDQLTKLDGNKIKGIAGSIDALAAPLAKIAGGGILAALGGSSGIASVADGLTKMGAVDIDRVSSGFEKLKTVTDGFDKQAAGIETFSKSVRKLSTDLDNLNTSLKNLASEGKGYFGGGTSNLEVISKSLGGGALGSGGASSGSSELQTKLNTLVEQLLVVTKEMNETNKDMLKAAKGSYRPV